MRRLGGKSEYLQGLKRLTLNRAKKLSPLAVIIIVIFYFWIAKFSVITSPVCKYKMCKNSLMFQNTHLDEDDNLFEHDKFHGLIDFEV